MAKAHVEVIWRPLDDDDDCGWKQIRCLYAYLASRTDEILYIGKSWSVPIRRRWNRSGKKGFWNDLETERKIGRHRVILGELSLLEKMRLTSALLSDTESLLISSVRPWGNIQAIRSRIARPGLIVRCRGDWPIRRKLFRDA